MISRNIGSEVVWLGLSWLKIKTSLLLRVKNLSELTPNMKRGIVECPVVVKQIWKEVGKPLHDLIRGRQSVFTAAAPAATLPVAICSCSPASTTWMVEAKHLLREHLLPTTHGQFTTPPFPDPRKTATTLYYIFIAQHIIAPNVWTVTMLLLIKAYPHIFLSIDIMMKGWKLTGKAENLII